MFNLRAAGTHTDKEIVNRINAMGYRTNIHHRWDRAHEKVIGSTGGVPLTVKRLSARKKRPVVSHISLLAETQIYRRAEKGI
jgi:hypothetical protein